MVMTVSAETLVDAVTDVFGPDAAKKGVRLDCFVTTAGHVQVVFYGPRATTYRLLYPGDYEAETESDLSEVLVAVLEDACDEAQGRYAYRWEVLCARA